MMTILKKLFALAAGLAFALLAPQSVAAPVTISAGQTAIFNFDYTGYTPAPPYLSLSQSWSMSGLFDDEEIDAGLITFFDGLNGTGSQLYQGNWDDASYFAGIGRAESEYVDGVFSMVFASIDGSVTIESISSVMTTATGEQVVYVATDDNNVPEPASLLLLASALLALSVARRKAGKSV